MTAAALKGLTTTAGILVVVIAAAMTADYAIARSRLARDTARIAELQAEARENAAASGALHAEQDRITRARLARNARTNTLSIALIAAAVLFVGGAKWRIAQRGRRPVVPPLVRVGLGGNAAIRGNGDTPHFRLQPAENGGGPHFPENGGRPDFRVVDEIVRQHGTSKEAAIPILQAIQAHYRYLPDEALKRVCELTDIAPAQIAGTSSFYARMRRSPVGLHVVRVCHGTACHVSGARQITDQLRRQLRIPDGADTDPQGLFTIDEVACLGCCSLAPVLTVDEHTAGRLTPSSAVAALDATLRAEPV